MWLIPVLGPGESWGLLFSAVQFTVFINSRNAKRCPGDVLAANVYARRRHLLIGLELDGLLAKRCLRPGDRGNIRRYRSSDHDARVLPRLMPRDVVASSVGAARLGLWTLGRWPLRRLVAPVTRRWRAGSAGASAVSGRRYSPGRSGHLFRCLSCPLVSSGIVYRPVIRVRRRMKDILRCR